jgi:hypothetical protein
MKNGSFIVELILRMVGAVSYDNRLWSLTGLSGSIKKGNRKSEILLRDVEVLTNPFRLRVILLI